MLSQTGFIWAIAQTGTGQAFGWDNTAAGVVLNRLLPGAAHDTPHRRRQGCMGTKAAGAAHNHADAVLQPLAC